ncbi:MAG TPA: DUF308 domain-containing protein [Nitrososphaeraceae archaeon]|nr:DUF308 domain-containing protein [Nitrososphaeraceae archaeon]
MTDSNSPDGKSPGWVRAAQIGLGALAVILSISILASPGLAIVSIVYFVGILLLIVGIESVITGIFIRSKSRWASVGLGILVIILAIIVMAFPLGTTIFLIILMGVALLINGISRVIHGFGDKESRGWSRGFSIGVGALEIALGILIMASPAFGVALVGLMIAIALLITGIQMIVAGISGRRRKILPASGR